MVPEDAHLVKLDLRLLRMRQLNVSRSPLNQTAVFVKGVTALLRVPMAAMGRVLSAPLALPPVGPVPDRLQMIVPSAPKGLTSSTGVAFKPTAMVSVRGPMGWSQLH